MEMPRQSIRIPDVGCAETTREGACGESRAGCPCAAAQRASRPTDVVPYHCGHGSHVSNYLTKIRAWSSIEGWGTGADKHSR